MATKDECRFIFESNAIEGEYSPAAFEDAYQAWREATCNQTGLNEKNVLTTHSILMKRLNRRIAGQLRDCNVTVGGRLCPPPHKVPALLANWFILHGDADTEEKIKKAHIAFEKIHPFEDGNGRVGRIIMNAQRLRAGLPILIIHEGKEQMEYYKWFK